MRSIRKPLLTTLIILIFLNQISGQENEYKIPVSPFINFIKEERFSGVNILPLYNKHLQLLPLTNTRFDQHPQTFFVLNGEIYVHIFSTGLVYKSISKNAIDSLTFKRLDKTDHYGYNINAFPFTYKNKLYNIGGYGFWHWNGQLRIFIDKAREWDIVKLNKEYPVAIDYPGSFFWISEQTQKLYSFSYIKGNDAIKSKDEKTIQRIDTVLELDLSSHEWKEKGILNKKLVNGITPQKCYSVLDSGILVSPDAPILLYLNLLANRVDTLKNIEYYLFFSGTSQDALYWYKNRFFYKATNAGRTLDSLYLNVNDLSRSNQQIYLNQSNRSFSNFYYLLLLLPILILFFYRKYFKLNLKETPEIKNLILNSPYKSPDLFDEIEKSVIILLFENAKTKGLRTSTDEINRILGVGNKSVDMQKRKRSDIIKSINKKYEILFPGTNALIIRVKSQLDARLFEYELNRDNLDFLTENN
jgi:hypothetical protein